MSVREAETAAVQRCSLPVQGFLAPSSESGPERPGGAAAKSGK
jgi:hypothetical protein